MDSQPARNWIILAAAGVVVMGVVVALVVWMTSRPAPVANQEDGRPVAEAFLAQIRAGQVDAAWESTTAEFKSDEGREQFRQFVARTPLLKQPLEFGEYRATELNGLKRGECLFQAAGSPGKVRVVVGREGDAWKTEGVFVE
jgi:hypothetical protein